MIENSLWVEKFRPKKLDDYIGNDVLKERVKGYIENEDVPHLLFQGIQGTGKTTLAKIIANSIDADILYINASDENNIETVRSKIKNFAGTMGFRKWKIIILDESDYLTLNAQAALRNLMETFSNTCRFILTCNYVNKIIPAIRSRTQEYEIFPPSKKAVALRLSSILKAEGIKFTLEDIKAIILMAYPDIRKVINIAQNNISHNTLKLDTTSKVKLSYMDEILDKLKSPSKTSFKEIRQILADSKLREFTDLYSFLYEHVDELPSANVASIIILLSDYQYKDALVVDKEINISAMISAILKELGY